MAKLLFSQNVSCRIYIDPNKLLALLQSIIW